MTKRISVHIEQPTDTKLIYTNKEIKQKLNSRKETTELNIKQQKGNSHRPRCTGTIVRKDQPRQTMSNI